MMQKFLSLLLLLFPLAVHADDGSAAKKLAPVKHILVFYLENHSFDNLFGAFPGADGIANAGDKAVQTDANGQPYAFLPRAMDGNKPDPRFPAQLPNQPFPLERYVAPNDLTGDLVHRFYQLQAQIDGGRMDHFVLAGDSGGLTMGYHDIGNSPLWQYAKRYTLADHFFTAAFGGSALNHFWLICACTPFYENAPGDMRSELDAKGNLLRDAPLTPDGYAVNTIQPRNAPFSVKVQEPLIRLPPQTLPTIGDRLSEKQIAWAWYGGGWKDAAEGHPNRLFQFHHHPFAYFAAYAPGTKARAEHLLDESDLRAAIAGNTLPAVAFYKPSGETDLHPGYSHLIEGEDHVFDIIHQLEKSPAWKDSLVIVTFDDAGGFWDHVPPPKGDRFGPGERVPTLIISPFAKKGYVDHTTYDTTAILKLIERKFALRPLADRDAKAADLTNALE